MTHSQFSRFLKSCLLWLLPGLTAGIAAAIFMTAAGYHNMSELAGSALQSGSVLEGIKHAGKEDRTAGEAYLSRYGYRPLGRLRNYLIPVTGVCIIFFEGIGLVLSLQRQRDWKKLKDRISSLTEYLRAVNAGDTGALIRTEDYFSHLEDEIYKTVLKLTGSQESAVRDHEALSLRIADIAHQLKTPLTSMSLMTELLEEYETPETRDYLDRLQNQIIRLHNLVSGLLTLARLDSHVLVFDRTEFDVAECIAESAESLREFFNRKNIALDIESDAGEAAVMITGDRHWFGEALLNVLKNCAEHTPIKGTIHVAYSQNPMFTNIVITDSGSGISKKDLPHLFERFYKGEGSAKDSAGIGLALSRLIIEEQNGQIHAENTSDGHARFQIKLYR